MSIYSYFFFSYGLTIIIALFTVGLIVGLNALFKLISGDSKNINKESV